MNQAKGNQRSSYARPSIAVAFAMCAACAASSGAHAGFVLGSNMLPPQAPYLSTTNVVYGGTGVEMDNLEFFGFSSQIPPPTLGNFSTSNASCSILMDLSFASGPFLPYVSSAFISILWTHDSDIGSTMHFDTEILSLNIGGGSLPPGVLIRESPTQASTGETTITPVGGGNYHIDSFFDIFTELSLDGGQTWNPGSTFVQSAIPPAPGVLALLGLGFLGLGTRRRH